MTDPIEASPLDGYEVLLCVTGCIAAYKSADLASRLVQAGAGVSVAMTRAARRFVAPLTFQTLCGRAVFTSLWRDAAEQQPQHIALTERADLMIVAPATANMLAKMAHGLADDLVSTLALSAAGACTILVAPAMNVRMWNAPQTQANLAAVTEWGLHTVGPGEGYLACGTVGIGRMAEPEEILAAATKLLRQNPPKHTHQNHGRRQP